MPRIGVPWRVRAALVVLLVLLVPLAVGQNQGPVVSSLRLSVEDPARAIPPNGSVTMPVHIVYVPGNGQPAPDPNEEDTLANKTRVTFAVLQKPSWAGDVVIEPSEVWVHVPLRPTTPTNREVIVSGVTVTVFALPDAPAEQRENISLEVRAHPNGNIPEAVAATPPLRLRAALVPKVGVEAGVESPLLIDGGNWASVPFVVRNLGNDELLVALNVTTRPERSEVRFPTETRIPVGGSESVTVEVRTPWTERETGTIELEAVAIVEEGEAQPARASVDVVGESAVPGLPLAPLLAALALLAWRRRARIS